MTESESPWTQQPAQGPAPGLRYANLAERVLATFIDYIVVALAASTPYALISADGATAGRFRPGRARSVRSAS